MNNVSCEISVVIPVYNCAECLNILCTRLSKVLSELCGSSYEIILVDDRSPLPDWEVIKILAEKDPKIKGVRLSRNFGQHHAIFAGLSFVKGKWVVVMDCDLQNPPEAIPKLYQKAKEGYDVVFGVRKVRQDKWYRKVYSNLFWYLFNWLANINLVQGSSKIGNFGIYSKKVIDSVQTFKEQHKNFGFFVLWSGFNKTYVEVNYVNRADLRVSSYSFFKLCKFAFDNIVAHSNALLSWSIIIGIIFALCSLLVGVSLIIKHLFFSPVQLIGWTSLIVTLFFLGGLIMVFLGILGIYVGKIYDEVKNRPVYLIDEVTFLE